MITSAAIPARAPLAATQTANIIFGLGNGALLMMTLFGFGWLGWAFAVGNMFTLAVMVLFYAASLTLLAVAILAIRWGNALRKIYFDAPDPAAAKIAKQFRLVVILEFAGIALAVVSDIVLRRPDLLAVWIGLVVGVHFLALAKLFHFRAYYWTGIAICLWDILCWVIFRSPATTVWAALGNGIALWLTVIYAVFRCRQLAQNLPAR